MRSKWLILLTIMILMITPLTAYADNTPYTFDADGSGLLVIDYKDDLDGNMPVSGAEFMFYKVAEIGSHGEYIPCIDGIDLSSGDKIVDAADGIRASYNGEILSGKTDADGKLEMELPFGVYLCFETSPAKEHLATTPFVCQLPYMNEGVWTYSVTAAPKPVKTGSLAVTKTVKGNGGSKSDIFNFKIEFTGDNNREYLLIDKDGAERVFKTGDSVSLTDGQKAVVTGIPEGVHYKVVEKEADKNGYKTTYTDAEGNIEAFVQKTAAFVNTKDVPSPNTTVNRIDTGDTGIMLYIGVGIFVIVLASVLLIWKKKKR